MIQPSAMPVRVTYKGRVYDVPRDFVYNVHPGGADSILPHEGGDITDPFQNVGHSDDAVAMLEDWAVSPQPAAAVAASAAPTKPAASKTTDDANKKPGCSACTVLPWLLAIVSGVAMFALLTRGKKKI